MAEEQGGDIIIKVIGVGGGGGNAINTMVDSKLTGVEFIAANTDMQALSMSRAPKLVQLGAGITRGMGAGADPDRGRDAAQESYDELLHMLEGAHMVFITAGLGGGTGTGAVPVIAKACKEVGALTVAVVSKPFYFEGKKRMSNAESGWQSLREHADTIITVPNDRLLSLMNKNSTMSDMLLQVDQVLLQAVRGITDLIKLPGFINVDFEDLKTVMREVGPAIMGTGLATGENRAVEAAKRAIDNQLLEDIGIDGARALLINVSASKESLTLSEYQEASALIQEKAHEDATVIVGVLYDESMGDDMRVTVIATGISSKEEAEMEPVLASRRMGAVPPPSPLARLRSRRTSFDGVPVAAERSSGKEAQAQPNQLPTGLARMPKPIFDEQRDREDLDEPAYLRKSAN
ncbi:MAG: cell division protein FtsZ [Desulfobulbaceae bacterium]|nr:cell division protein FtsZ [Desulfobulbaceae bacterium]